VSMPELSIRDDGKDDLGNPPSPGPSSFLQARKATITTPQLPPLKRTVSMTSTAALATPSSSVPRKAYGGFSELPPANVFIQERDGQILGKGMVLKSDYIPSADRAQDLDVHISGAANFRRARPLPIYASAQPSLYGIRAILNILSGMHVRWICLREEPLIYINNRPFVLRDQQHPFRNLRDFQGIDYKRLEMVEKRLKKDILREAELNNGNILVVL